MSDVGIFYGSTSGNTAHVAKVIQKATGGELHDVSSVNAEELGNYTLLILGTSTWGAGDIQDDWGDFLEKIRATSFENKRVALFGLGDQFSYSDNFVDGMRDIYDVITANGGNVIGRCDDNGEYDYCESRSVVDGKFVGLPLDEDNQSNMTKTRVISWLEQISKECSSCCGSCG